MHKGLMVLAFMLCLVYAGWAWGAAFELAATGELRFTDKGKSLLKAELVFPGQKWQGRATLQQVQVKRRDAKGRPVELREAFALAGASLEVETRLEYEAETAKVHYSVKPQQTIQGEGLFFTISLPVEVFKGKPYELAVPGSELKRGDFPEKLSPAHYIFATGSQMTYLALPIGERYLIVQFQQSAPPYVMLQDNRKFNSSEYEFLALIKSTPLEADKRLDFTVSMALVDAKRLEGYRRAFKEELMSNFTPLESKGTLALSEIALNRRSCPQYEKLEVTCRLQGTWNNPYDPEQVKLDALVTAPDGRQLVVPGFFYQRYDRKLVDEHEEWQRVGEPCWKVRFAPRVPGKYTLILRAENQGRTVESEPLDFTCTQGEGEGFIYRAKNNPYYFAYESGKPYFPIGENVCWPGQKGTYDYDEWFGKLAAEGGNYARLWASNSSLFILERAYQGRPDAGLGKYLQDHCAATDYVFELAEKLGIKLMYCMESFNMLRFSKPYPAWEYNVYNKANGGMLEKPEDFFTNPEAKRYFKQRLRYIVARWGYSPALFAWEFWNEVDIIQKYDSPAVAAWHQEMGRYLRQLDCYDHLLTTSFAFTNGDKAVNELPEIDFVQAHNYGSSDVAKMISSWSKRYLEDYAKPFFFGEFGVDVNGKRERLDEQGLYLHNGLWAALASGDAGTAMTWWWDNYVDPANLYHVFRPVSRFIEDIPFTAKHWRPLAYEAPEFLRTPEAYQPLNLSLECSAASWDPAPFNKPQTFKLERDGRLLQQAHLLPKVLHGVRNHPDLHNPVTFEFEYTYPGTFTVSVHGVSGWGGAGLRISLDGQAVLEKAFPQVDENDHETIHAYDGKYTIKVPAGRHRITVENIGDDWMYVDYSFEGGFVSIRPNLRLFGRAADDYAFGWIQDRSHTWFNVAEHGEPPIIAPTRVPLKALKAGRYEVTYFDTYKGKVLSRSEVRCADGLLVLELPQVKGDLAFKVQRVGD